MRSAHPIPGRGAMEKAPKDQPRCRKPVPPPRASRPPGGAPLRRRVLIADDEEDTRSLLRAMLEAQDWEVIEARDGQEALEKIIDELPDLVVIDNRMPARTGAEVCQHLRQGSIAIPVVLMTGASRASDLARSLGLQYFLAKPFDVATVLSVVEHACEDRVPRPSALLGFRKRRGLFESLRCPAPP